MTVFELMSRLGAAGVKLWVEEGQLKFKAPKGALTAELKDALVAKKSEVIEFLSGTRVGTSGDADRIPLADRSQPLHLSHAQNRLWFIEQLTPGNSTFHIPAPMLLNGILDQGAMERAFLQLLQRHEALRTVIREVEGEPRQIVQSIERFVIPVEDLTSLPTGERQQSLQEKVERETRAPFDLANGPMVRAKLFKLDDNQHALVVVIHHIVTDGWSMGIFVREMAALYAAERMGVNATLPPLPVQYGDFSEWQRNWLQGDVLDRQIAYWQQQLANAPVSLDLPFDRPRPAVVTRNGTTLPVSFDSTLTDDIKKLARKLDTTAYVILLAAYKILLGRWSRQRDICVGMPVAGRTRPEVEGLIGFFVNTLAIRTQQTGKPTFEQFVRQVREKVLGAQMHQDIPFEVLVEELNVPRNLSFAPVYQVSLSFTGAEGSADKVRLGGLEIAPLELELSGARAEMSLMLADHGQTIHGMIEYNTDLFDRATIEIFVQHLQRLLQAFTRHPESCIDTVALLNDSELKEALNLSEHCEAVLPLAPMQRDFFIDSLKSANTLRNTIGEAFELPFVVDVERWHHAIQKVADANPLQRVRLVESTKPWLDPFYQVVEHQQSVWFECLDWSAETLTPDALQTRLDQLILRPWNVLHSPLIRHYLVKQASGRSLYLMTAHHAIMDGGSRRFHREAVLQAYLTGAVPVVTPARIQDWILQRTRKTDNQAVLDFWRQALAEAEPLATRVADPGDAQVQTWTLSAADYQALEQFCGRHGVSAAGYLRALYALALDHCSHHNGPVVLIDAVAARQDVTFESNGCFFQFVPDVLQKVEPQQTIWDLVQANRAWRKSIGDAIYLSMMARQQFLNPNGIEFQFNARVGAIQESVHIDGRDIDVYHAQPDNAGTVKLMVNPHQGGAILRYSFRKQEFGGFDLLQRIAHVHNQILAGVDTLQQLDWLLPEEKAQQLAWQGKQDTGYGKETLLDLMAAQVDRRPDQVAVICGTRQQTYRELDSLSNRIAHWLQSRGVQRGQRVALCVGRSLELPALYLGVIKSGAAYVPMDAGYPADRIAFIAEDSQAPVLITEQCVLQRLRDANVQLPDSVECLLLDDLDSMLAGHSDQPLTAQPTPDDLLYYVYTSGSTGRPKGAGVYHRGERNLLQWYADLLQLAGQDRVLLISALGFDLTQKNLFIPFCTGATLVIPDFEDYDPERLADLIARQQVSVINCAPSAFYPIAELDQHGGYPFASLRHVVLGGEPIRLNTLKPWFDHPAVHCVLTNSYGPTECSDVVASYSLQSIDDPALSMPVGRPLANTQLYIVDQSGHLLPTGAVGELCIAGIGVGAGYWNRDDLNAQAFASNPYGEGRWYRTGDLVRYNPQGEIVYVGRKDFQVKLRGLRIEPGEVDSLLKQMDHVRDALTLVRDERLISYVLSHHTFDVAAAREALRGKLPDFMVPAALVVLDAWPLTPNGKIDRKALPQPDQGVLGPYVAPRNDSEQRIADIWCQVLKLPKVSVHANFFEVGGHSLLATQVVSRIRQAFGVELSVRTLFESPTIEKLTRAIGGAAAAGLIDTAPPLVALHPPNRDTLSFAQYRLWFVDQLNQGSSEYNLPSALRIRGALDVTVLDRVLGEIVRRHESLRTNFAEKDGVPQLIVRPPQEWHSPLVDLSAAQGSEQQRLITQWVDQDANVTFDLASDSLFTTRILKLATDDHIILLNMHHIISDGWSIGVLVQEIQALYFAFAAGQSSPLPPLPIQYSDFAVWQRQWLQGETLDKLREYWKSALRGAPDVLRLPTDKPRPKIQTFNGAHSPVQLGRALTEKVKHYCDQHDLTPFMVLMGAYQLLLSRYTQQQDICVGIPIAGRNRTEIENLIGFFINGLVIRTRLDGNPSVQDYFTQVKQVALGAYAHQDMPADVLLDTLKLERSADTSPGAQVGFALQNVAQTDLSAVLGNLSIEPVPREHKTAKYELSLILQENNGEIGGVAEYNTDLFFASTIERMMRQYCHVLEQMLDQPEQLLDAVQVVSLDELYGLLHLDVASCELQRLSPMQRDMYLDTLLEPATLKNSLGYHFITSGDFDLNLWQQASQLLVDTQPLLRASLLAVDLPYVDVAYLNIDRQRTVRVHFEDRSATPMSDQQAADFAQSLIWQPYDIHGELHQSFVFKLDRGRHLVVFRANHILLDGAGMAVHLHNVIAAAESLRAQQHYLSAPVIYPDYVQENLRRTDTHEVIAHWRNTGRSVEALDFSLPPQHKPATPGQRVERHLRLDDQHWQQLQRYCEQQRITPSLYFKALYGLLINAYCRGEADFVVSEVVGGRNGVHRRAFGNYFQVLPVVFPQDLFKAGHRVDDLFAYIRNYRKSLRGNANVSLLTQRHTLPQGRLHFMFNYYNFIPTVTLFGTPVQLKAYPQVQNGPVQFVVHEQDGWLELNLIYLADLFADIDFLPRIASLSQQILAGQNSVDQLELVLPLEQARQRSEWNATAQALPAFASVVQWFDAQADRSPDQVAVKQGAQQLSYRALLAQANQLANWLIGQGVQSRQMVGICLDRSPQMLVAVLGVLKAGAAYVPMDSQYPAERLAYMLADSQAPLLLTQRCIVEKLQESATDLGQTRVVELDQSPAYLQASTAMPARAVQGEDPIYVIYTSGSTGKPKGAVVRHSGEVNLQQWYINSLGISAQDRFLLVSAFGFDLSQKNLFAPILTGGTLVLPEMENYDVEAIAHALAQERISVINCAPSAFYPLVEHNSLPGYPFPHLRYAVLGGEPIRMSAFRDWLALPQTACRIVNSYGPTECTDVVSYHINTDNAAETLPIGKPVCNTQLYILDDQHHLLPEGVIGELCVAGTGVGLGYLGRPELNAKVFQPNPFGDGQLYRTGDLARYWPDGNIEYIGRKDFQIKLRGLRIELGEIEHALRELPGVQDSLTLVRDDQLVSYLIAAPNLDVAACRTKLRTRLPDYMVPALMVVLSHWPLTPNGKIDRAALPAPGEESRRPYVAPRNETEEKLAAIWSEVLGVERVGIHDSFFDLGGHSLVAARAVSKFRQAFDVDIPLRALFELHTIADIAQYLETLQWAARNADTSQQDAQPSEGRDEGFL
jgi:amino acid adenylation domain-containing protein